MVRLVDASGSPLAVRLSPANRHDSGMLGPMLDAVPAIRQCHGRPRRRSAKLHADKAYDHAACRQSCRERKIAPRTGDLLIAPAFFTHTHRGNRPEGRDKYIATSWILFQAAEALFGKRP